MSDDHEVTGEIASPQGDAPPRRRKRRFVIWGVVLLVFVGVFWLAMRSGGKSASPHAAAAPPVAVVTATVTRSDLPIYLEALGTVTPIYTVSITSQITGRVVSVHYQEGQLVRSGTALVDIDPRPLAATLLQAQGTLEHDTHVLEQARMDLDRYRAAWDKRAIQRQLLDDQEKLVLQSEATVKVDRGVVEYDRIQLEYCHITSPITGRVGLRLIDPGNLVTANAGAVLAVITQIQPISVVFTISEDDLSEVLAQPGHGENLPVTLLDRVKAKQLATGHLITIDNQIDTTTGTVRLRALFDNAGDVLFPNQFVNARLLVKTLRSATVLPTSAIQRDAQQAFVYTIRNDHAKVQRVTVGAVAGDLTEVTGVAPGDVVANSSFEKLRDGAAVTAAPPPAQAMRDGSAQP